MKTRQKGMTTLGLIILVAFVGLFAFAGLRLTPIYLNYMKVVGVVEGVREEFDGMNASSSAIRTSIRRRFDIESVGIITAGDVKVAKVSEGYEISATYSHKAPFIADVSFVVDFDKRALVRR
jgi:hypothetical protein